MEEVTLRIGDVVFQVDKERLCNYSDYFRAMFSGCYTESEKQEIIIDMLDADTMSIILEYMQIGMIRLSVIPLETVGEIALAANFLQMSDLVTQIQFFLDTQLGESNWMDTMVISENACYTQIEKYSAAYGLCSFNSMKLENIPTIHKLIWYLSHPYLDSHNEYNVFKFGLEWLIKNHQLDDAVLIFACLDMKRVTYATLMEIRELLCDYISRLSNTVVLEMIDCLLDLTSKDLKILESCLHEQKSNLCAKFSVSVWSALLSIVKGSRPRLIKYVPVVPLLHFKDKLLELSPHCLYTYEEDKGFEKYLEVAEENLWGWSVTPWGPTKLVFVCGEIGRWTGNFMRDVKVYDTLKQNWTQYGVQLPPRCHAGVTTVGDLLYVVGGEVGCESLASAYEYNLKQRSFRSIASFYTAVQSPSVCTHNNQMYTAVQKNVYCYYSDDDSWKRVLRTQETLTLMRSFNNYIYCTDECIKGIFRFRPGIDNKLQIVSSIMFPASSICNVGNKSLMVFTQVDDDKLVVEEYKGVAGEKPRVITTKTNNMRVSIFADCIALVMTIPPLCRDIPEFQKEYLMRNTKT